MSGREAVLAARRESLAAKLGELVRLRRKTFDARFPTTLRDLPELKSHLMTHRLLAREASQMSKRVGRPSRMADLDFHRTHELLEAIDFMERRFGVRHARGIEAYGLMRLTAELLEGRKHFLLARTRKTRRRQLGNMQRAWRVLRDNLREFAKVGRVGFATSKKPPLANHNLDHFTKEAFLGPQFRWRNELPPPGQGVRRWLRPGTGKGAAKRRKPSGPRRK